MSDPLGTITIDAADDGVHTNKTLVINGGTFSIATGDDGLHSDAALTINGLRQLGRMWRNIMR